MYTNKHYHYQRFGVSKIIVIIIIFLNEINTFLKEKNHSINEK